MKNGQKLIPAGTGRNQVGPNTLLAFRPNKKAEEAVDWAYIDALTIATCISAITMAGGALMLGRTSDGGAYSVCVLVGNDKLKEYPHSKVECEELLVSLTEHFG